MVDETQVKSQTQEDKNFKGTQGHTHPYSYGDDLFTWYRSC
jgi:hypothetical protein